MAFSPEILQTVNKSWNETKPLKEAGYIPTFDPPKPDDPKKGGREDEVMKSYGVGVALEREVPAEWEDATFLGLYAGHELLAMAPGLCPIPPGLAVAASLSPDALVASTMKIKDSKELYRPGNNKNVRVVVYGHGGLFIGKELDPGRQTLLLNSVNWLLGRADRMPIDKPDGEKWRYPRVTLSGEQWNLWDKATRFGLPALAIYFCFMVLMVRRFR